MFRPPVRAITLGVAEPHPLPARVIERAGSLLRRAANAYQDAGYEVQTVRLSTRPVFDREDVDKCFRPCLPGFGVVRA